MRISDWSSDVCSSDLNRREDRGHRLYPDATAKWGAVARAVEAVRAGDGMRPVLVGTRSVGDSEAVAAALDRRGIAYRILNARQDAEEAAIVDRKSVV